MRICNHKLPKGVTCGVCLYCGKEVQKVLQPEEKGKAPEPVYVLKNEKAADLQIVTGLGGYESWITMKAIQDQVFQDVIAKYWLPLHLLGEPRYRPQG